jgi:hypothetical protein
MPKKSLKVKTTTGPAKSENVSFDITLDGNTFARTEKYKAAKGMLKPQEVIRLALGVFLEKQGY